VHDLSQKNDHIQIVQKTILRNSREDIFQSIFSSCRRILGTKTWGRILAALEKDSTPETFADTLSSLKNEFYLPDFIDDLARLEWVRHHTEIEKAHPDIPLKKICVNPALTLVPVSWKHLTAQINTDAQNDSPIFEPAQTHVMVWRHPKTGRIETREAEDIDLLALKLAIEEIDPREAANIGNINVKAIHTALDRAITQGILISPASLIRRTSSASFQASEDPDLFLSADIFTLQWHITQACDLHCKHCYDRSDRSPMPYDMAISILDDFYGFCRDMHVKGQVSFTGGNPLLYPHFFEIYQAASDRGFEIAILGNPTPAEKIKQLLKIAKPAFFQISLEGLDEYNDYIRGKGHFKRSLAFLDQLRSMDIYTMVMLTLTRDNMDQVLPLAGLLTDRADHFTFNRLSTVGEGKQLLMPEKKEFETFLRKYEAAADKDPLLGLKDNLINIICLEKGIAPFGGCTGYGCGAAFNFAALLPDGEVHACRKFPSPIGNILENRLIDIYQSDLAQNYRTGSQACRNCSLNPVCRGCLAITYSHGLDIFKDKDPFCFMPKKMAS
jgi:selenobiotic family peptide radical SAM maturase